MDVIATNSTDRIIGKLALVELVGLSVSQLARLEKEGRFPQRIYIAKRRVGWSLKEVSAWIEERKNSRIQIENKEGL